MASMPRSCTMPRKRRDVEPRIVLAEVEALRTAPRGRPTARRCRRRASPWPAWRRGPAPTRSGEPPVVHRPADERQDAPCRQEPTPVGGLRRTRTPSSRFLAAIRGAFTVRDTVASLKSAALVLHRHRRRSTSAPCRLPGCVHDERLDAATCRAKGMSPSRLSAGTSTCIATTSSSASWKATLTGSCVRARRPCRWRGSRGHGQVDDFTGANLRSRMGPAARRLQERGPPRRERLCAWAEFISHRDSSGRVRSSKIAKAAPCPRRFGARRSRRLRDLTDRGRDEAQERRRCPSCGR